MSKLAFIIPYDMDLAENQLNHYKEILKNFQGQYKFIFVEQKSNRPVNKGKLFNIGYLLNKNYFDYFCFQDSYLIALNDDINFENTRVPTCLLSSIKKLKFGEQEEIDGFTDFEKVEDNFFDGAIISSKESFEKINGFSNDYWGSSYVGKDFLCRLVNSGFDLHEKITKSKYKNCAVFDGMNSRIDINCETNSLKRLTDGNFSISCWFSVENFPQFRPQSNKHFSEYFLFGREGYHTGISVTHDGKLKVGMWDYKSNYYYVTCKIDINIFYHVVMTFNNQTDELKLFLNGNYIGKSVLQGQQKRLTNNNLHIGMASFERNRPMHPFQGFISECGAWDYTLNDAEILKIYQKGIYNDYYNTSETPVGYWSFETGYDNIIFDSSKDNHGISQGLQYAKKEIKKPSTEYLPYRRNGYFGFIGSNFQYKLFTKSDEIELETNIACKNLFTSRMYDMEKHLKEDGLGNTRFRIVKRENFKQDHELIQVIV
tara:strand:+ start:762 stop:2216 length:1455 start_codon:yes stop_codon:yes gene_type:complete